MPINNPPSQGGGVTLPVGLISMWSGTLAAIPSGWALCDGQAGRPDLRAQFIKGAAVGVDPGGTGGAATHAHTQHGALTHAGSTVADHAAQTHIGGTVADHSNVSVPGTGTAAVKIGTSTSTAAAQAHTHTIPTITHSVTQPNQHAFLAHSVTQPDGHSVQTHSTESNEPAYYTLAFIIYTG